MSDTNQVPITLYFTQFPAQSNGSVVINNNDMKWSISGNGGGRSSGLTISSDQAIGLYTMVINDSRIELDTRPPAGSSSSGGKAIDFHISLFVTGSEKQINVDIDLDGQATVSIKAGDERSAPYGTGNYTIGWD